MDISLKEQETEARNKKRARILSAIIHALLLIVLLVMVKYTPIPEPPTNEGIMIAFGQVDAGGGFEEPVEAEEAEEVEYEEAVEPETSPAELTPTSNPKPDVQTADNSEEINLNREKLVKAKKDELGRNFGEKDNSGSGGGDKPGNEGDPNSNLPGGGTGGGTTGSGYDIKGRTKVESHKPENPGIDGRIVIEICIDRKGNVLTAEYTQKGSNTNNPEAVAVAVASAKKWKFNADEMAGDKVCGSVTYNFKRE